MQGSFQIATPTTMSLMDITGEICQIVKSAAISTGTLVLYNPHTTAGLTINEGTDPDVRHDILAALQVMVPTSLNYRHAEGNSRAHIMTLLTGSSLTIQIQNSNLQLGTWQKIFFCEYDGPRNRRVNWQILRDKID